MGVEVLLLLRCVTALVAAVAPTEHICTDIFLARYTCIRRIFLSPEIIWRNMAESKKNQVKASKLSLLLNVLQFAQAGIRSQKECRILRIYFG